MLTPADPCAGSGGRVGAEVPTTTEPDRTGVAPRRRPAHRGAEVHQRLVPHPARTGGHEPIGSGLGVRRGEPSPNAAGEHAGDVRVDHGDVALVGERQHGAGGVGTDAGEGDERRQLVGHTAAVAFDASPMAASWRLRAAAAGSRGPARAGARRRAGRGRTRRATGTPTGRPPTSARRAPPASAAASPPPRARATGRGFAATAGRAAAARPRRGRGGIDHDRRSSTPTPRRRRRGGGRPGAASRFHTITRRRK